MKRTIEQDIRRFILNSVNKCLEESKHARKAYTTLAVVSLALCLAQVVVMAMLIDFGHYALASFSLAVAVAEAWYIWGCEKRARWFQAQWLIHRGNWLKRADELRG